jgi:hypothetical protein
VGNGEVGGAHRGDSTRVTRDAAGAAAGTMRARLRGAQQREQADQAPRMPSAGTGQFMPPGMTSMIGANGSPHGRTAGDAAGSVHRIG